MACHAIYPDVYRPRLPGEPAVEQEFSRERNEYKHPPLFMQDKEKMVAAMRARNRIRRQAWFCQNPWIHPDSPWIGHRTSTIPLKLNVMDASIGVNLRVTAHSNQGGRKYMEDMFCVAYQPTSDEKDLLYAYFGIFDGHGGREAAMYAKTHLMDHIVQQKNFWSDDDELVKQAIRDGFINVHHAMWRELEKWPKTQSGLPSTSGTTASVAFVRRGKLYIGHVGDSGIVLGYQDSSSSFWKARPLTNDHKPETPMEHDRILKCGGKVVSKSGVPRVVWNRPRLGHQGPVRRSTLIDEIPFLAVARSLGDLWSYNSEQDKFVVSPEPDVTVIDIDVNAHRCLILGSDGLWNMLTCQDAVNSVYFAEKNNERHHQLALAEGSTAGPKNWINPSKRLVDRALDRWYGNNLRADNTSVVTVVIDPPGPPKKQPSPRQSSSSASSSTSHHLPSSRPSCAHTNHASTPSPRYSRIMGGSRNSESVSPPRSIPRPAVGQAKSPPGRPRSAERMTSVGHSEEASTSPSTSREAPARRPGPERANRRKKMPLVSSKTSRVLARSTSNTSLDSESSGSGPMSSTTSNQSFSDNHADAEDTTSGDDVQIHEISSSCETNRAEGAEARDSVLPVETNGKLGERKMMMRKVNKRMPKSSASSLPVSTGSSSSRKRMARSSESTTEEATTQRKIMKVSNETVLPRRPSAAKKGLIAAGVGKPRGRPRSLAKGKASADKVSGRSASSIAEAKENGRKLPRRISTSAMSTRATRGNSSRDAPVVESSTADVSNAVVSSAAATSSETSRKPVKPTDGSESLSSIEGTRVTNAKKPLRGAPPPTTDSVESQEVASPSKRLTRGVGAGSPAPTLPGKPLNHKKVPTKRETNHLPRSTSRTSRGISSDSSLGAKKSLKVSLKRLKAKAPNANADPELPSPRRSVKQMQGKKAENADDEGASKERSLRSTSSSALRVTRSKGKK